MDLQMEKNMDNVLLVQGIIFSVSLDVLYREICGYIY